MRSDIVHGLPEVSICVYQKLCTWPGVTGDWRDGNCHTLLLRAIESTNTTQTKFCYDETTFASCIGPLDQTAIIF